MTKNKGLVCALWYVETHSVNAMLVIAYKDRRCRNRVKKIRSITGTT